MNWTELDIRPASPDEVMQVAALVNAAYEKWIAVIGDKPRPMLADYDALTAQGRVYCVRHSDELAAVLVLWPVDGALYIDNLAVSPAHQKQGIGAHLLEFAESQARSLGLPLLRLCTNQKMLYNQAYYARHGFSETARESAPDGRHVVWMEKQV
jgi:ribosomal protein S18 acetylase RimI-like enzyme